MIKKFLSFSFATAMMAMGMVSCSNEDLPVNEERVTVQAVATGTIEEEMTRTNRFETPTELKFTWAKGDKVVVISSTGTNCGVLTVDDSADGQSSGTLRGTLTVGSGEQVHIYYLGAKTEADEFVSESQEFDLSTQEGLENALDDYDVMHSEATVEMKDGLANFSFNLKSMLSFGHFCLHMPEGVDMPQEVTVKGQNIMNKVEIDLANGSLANTTPGEIKAKVGADGQVFLNMIPAQNAVTEFEVTVGGTMYHGALKERTYTANKNFNGGKYDNGKDVYFVEGEGDDWRLIYNYQDGRENTVVTGASWSNYYNFTVMADPTRDGYNFLGWAESANGTPTIFAGHQITLNRPDVTRTLYAIWEGKTYTLHYVVDGVEKGSSEHKNTTTPWIFYPSQDVDTPVKAGYTFLGWADSASATAADYQHNGSINLTPAVTDKTVYAVFKKNGTSGNVTVPGSEGVGY